MAVHWSPSPLTPVSFSRSARRRPMLPLRLEAYPWPLYLFARVVVRHTNWGRDGLSSAQSVYFLGRPWAFLPRSSQDPHPHKRRTESAYPTRTYRYQWVPGFPRDRGSPGLFLPQCDVADRLQVFHTSKSCGVSGMDQRPFRRGPSGHGPGYRPPVLTTRYRWTLPTSHGSGHYFLFFFFTHTPDVYNCPFLPRKRHLFLYHGHFIYCVSYTYLVTMRRPPTARLLFLSLSMYLFSFLCVL